LTNFIIAVLSSSGVPAKCSLCTRLPGRVPRYRSTGMYSSRPNFVRDLCAGIARIQRQREDIDMVVKTMVGLITAADMQLHASEGSVDLRSRNRDTGQWCISIVRPQNSNGQDFWISRICFSRDGVVLYEYRDSGGAGVKPQLSQVGIVHYQLKYLVGWATKQFPDLEERLAPFFQ
jgi:hypothetical protein